MPLHEFKIGDEVRLRTDGRHMIVEAVVDEPDRSVKYVCVWFKNEETHRSSFTSAELALITKPPHTVP